MQKHNKGGVIAIICAALVILLAAAGAGLWFVQNSQYEEGLELWQRGQYEEAALMFSKAFLIPDARARLDGFEEIVIEGLLSSSWRSEYAKTKNAARQERRGCWVYTFQEDGTVLRQSISYTDGTQDEPRDPYEFSYSLVYGDQVGIRIVGKLSDYTYELYTLPGETAPRVTGFRGMMQFGDDFTLDYTIADPVESPLNP